MANPVGLVFGERTTWWCMFGLLCLLLLFPLSLADIPPILDYPNHLARMFVLADGDDTVRRRFWQPHWAVIPDIGADILIPSLMQVMPPFAAGKVMLALALLAPLTGAVAYSRAAFKERLYWPMTTGLTAYNLMFVFGFMNYLISLGGALLAAALWLRLRTRPLLVRALAGAGCASALFFVHMFGVAFFAVLAGAAEAEQTIAERGRPGWLRDMLRRAALLAASFMIPAILWFLVPPHNVAPDITGRSLMSKPFYLGSAFAAYQIFPGFVVALVFFGIAFYWLIVRGRRCAGPGVRVALAIVAIAYMVCPFSAGGGMYLDSRIALMVALILAAGLRPPPMRHWIGICGVALAAAVLAGEVAAIGGVWHGHEEVVAELRQDIATVPAGSKVLAISAPFDPAAPYWRNAPPGIVALGLFRTDNHLPALVTIDRQAFWPLLFSDPSQHPIVVQQPYAALAGDGDPPWIDSLIAGRSLDTHWTAPYLKDWPKNFDFVLLIDATNAGDLSTLLPDRLRLVSRGPYAALFAIRKADALEAH